MRCTDDDGGGGSWQGGRRGRRTGRRLIWRGGVGTRNLQEVPPSLWIKYKHQSVSNTIVRDSELFEMRTQRALDSASSHNNEDELTTDNNEQEIMKSV